MALIRSLPPRDLRCCRGAELTSSLCVRRSTSARSASFGSSKAWQQTVPTAFIVCWVLGAGWRVYVLCAQQTKQRHVSPIQNPLIQAPIPLDCNPHDHPCAPPPLSPGFKTLTNLQET